MMTLTEIRKYVERIIYKPDWSFETTYAMGGEEFGSCDITISWTVPDTSKPPTYTEKLHDPMINTCYVQCQDLASEYELGRRILEACIDLERRMLVHEAREYFRVAPLADYIAPFHPHHYDSGSGRDNWSNTSHLQLIDNKELPDG